MFSLQSEIDLGSLSYVGTKAGNLTYLAQQGVLVPKGMVVLPGDDSSSIRDYVRQLLDKPDLVAVRSSAIGEDGDTHSFAGQFKTLLNVDATSKSDLIAAVIECQNSATEAQDYADANGEKVGDVAVLIQRMIKPLYAGVLFTADPINGKRYVSIMEWVKGLADKMVGGEVSPAGSLEVITSSLEVVQGKRPRWTWQKVIQLGRQVDDLFEQPMDIEWAYTRGKVWCLQARPLTGTFIVEEAMLSGMTVVKGAATGTAKWMPSNHDKFKIKIGPKPKFNDGDILLTQMTDPHMITEMCQASAIATKIGGRTCHAAIIARELGKPCIVGVEGELSKFHGRNVTVDGDAGTVFTNG